MVGQLSHRSQQFSSRTRARQNTQRVPDLRPNQERLFRSDQCGAGVFSLDSVQKTQSTSLKTPSVKPPLNNNSGCEFQRLEIHSPVQTKLYTDTDEGKRRERKLGGQKARPRHCGGLQIVQVGGSTEWTALVPEDLLVR